MDSERGDERTDQITTSPRIDNITASKTSLNDSKNKRRVVINEEEGARKGVAVSVEVGR